MRSNDSDMLINKRIANLEIVNQYISNREDTKNIEYNVYFPKEIGNSTTKNLKNAIDEIAYSEFHSSLKIIIELLSRFEDSVKEKNPCSDLLSGFKALIAKPIISNDDYIKTCSFLVQHSAALRAYVKKNKNKMSAEANAIANDLLFVWLEGLYLHACIQIDRKKIQAIIFAPFSNQQLVEHPVAEAQIWIPTYEANAIRELIAYEAEQALPPVLAILHEIQALIADLSGSKTDESIKYAIKILKDANEKLYLSTTEIPGVLGELKRRIIPDLQELVSKLTDCHVNEAIVLHIKELIVWLEGLYGHSFCPPKKSWLKEKTEKLKEGVFTKVTGLTKKDIGSYYHQAANSLRECIKQYEKNLAENTDEPYSLMKVTQDVVIQKDEEPVMLSSQTNSPATSVATEINTDPEIGSLEATTIVLGSKNNSGSENDERAITFKLSNTLELTLKVKDASLVNQIIKLDNESLSLLNNFFTGKITLQPSIVLSAEERKVAQNELEFWKLLNEAKSSTVQVKIDALYNALHKLDISPEQKSRLLYLKAKAAASVEGYKNDTYFKEFLPTLSAKLFPRANLDVADETLNNLCKTSFDETAEDPKTILLELFKSRAKLLEKKKSHTLLPCIEALILEAYEHLLNKIPRLLEEPEQKKKLNSAPKATLFSCHHKSSVEANEKKQQRSYKMT